MSHRIFWNAAKTYLFVSVLSQGLCAEDAAKTSAPEAPDWALGVVAVRDLGAMRKSTAAFANTIVPNSGELGVNVVLNKAFPIPLNSGIKPNGAALIYFVAPQNPTQPIEKAFVLPLADAAALKAALAASLGLPTDNNGVLTYSIPQAPPDADKPLVVKFVRENALIAPSAECMSQLETFLGDRDGSALTGDCDAIAAVKVASFKRAYGDTIMPILDLTARTQSQTPEQADALKAQIHQVMDRVWQIDRLEARLTLNTQNPDRTAVALELSVNGLPGTEVATALTGDAPTVAGKLNGLLPYDPAFLLVWNVNPTDAAHALREAVKMSALKDSTDEVKLARLKILQSLIGLVQTIKGDALLAAGARSGQPVTPLIAGQSDDTKKSLAALIDVYRAVVDAMNAESRAKNGANAFTEEQAPPETIAGVAVTGRKLAIMGSTDTFMDNIFQLRAAELKGAIAIVTGSAAKETFAAAVQNSTAPAALPPDLQPLFNASSIPKGAAAILMLRPIAAIKAFASVVNPQGPAEKLTDGLSAAPLALIVRVADAKASLRLELPAAIPAAILQLSQRLRRAGLTMDELFRPVKDVAAPPAP